MISHAPPSTPSPNDLLRTGPVLAGVTSPLIPSTLAAASGLTKQLRPLNSQPPPQHGDFWTCDRTGLVVPKRIDANLRWREQILTRAAKSQSFRRQIRSACEKSVLFWINGFAWTFRQKETRADGEEASVTGHAANVPFVTWLCQDSLIEELESSIRHGRDVLVDKSRDMGASWCILTVIHHAFQFRRNHTFLEISRKLDLVDKRGDMDSLLEKHRYLLRNQPAWLRPKSLRDTFCHLQNEDTGSTIDGESTNEYAGQGGRRTAIFLDEFARIDNGEAIEHATADSSACRIFTSTPNGPGTWFSKLRASGRVKVITLHWSQHPEKGRSCYQIRDTSGAPRWTNVWYQKQRERRTAQDVAMNLDIDHGQAGDVFFAKEMIERHRSQHQREPESRMSLVWAQDLGPEAMKKAVRSADLNAVIPVWSGKRMPWRLWISLVGGRPPQDLTYGMGVDVSTGAGHSNSVITVRAMETGTVVAKWWDSNTSPELLAEEIARAGVWFGGRYSPPLVCHENNGPGGIVGRKLWAMGYSHLYLQRAEGTTDAQKSTRYGWNSSNEKKIALLASYREELQSGRFIQPCEQSLDETLDYVFDEHGLLLPGRLREEKQGGRMLHGDHVIADALTVLALRELPRHREQSSAPPSHSFEWRRRAYRAKKAESERWS